MLLMRNSISTTKKFFQRTLGNLKSFFTGGSYQKLPKSPRRHPFSGNSTTVAATTTTINIHQCDSTTCTKKRIITSSNSTKQEKSDDDDHISTTTTTTNQVEKKKNDQAYPRKVMIMNNIRKLEDYNDCKDQLRSNGEGIRKYKYRLVEEKLKEIEMLDLSNVDHVLDIEEVLHYYSRLTCPAYIEIIDRFFMDTFAELFSSSTPTQRVKSRLRPPSLMIRS
ncbi:hypothetical protein PanWU01x14_222800 [Parasponia andersonii]|uniref:Uncharacterized protein n=1 Tax=Parasponia andersonii TaxID=3476 RepID=A0A2P5BP47_PARAD|nr:hypothetical protein PanWU01x14_222800 [Parasponia andersonii]